MSKQSLQREHAKLVEEDGCDGDGTDEADEEEEDGEKTGASPDGAPVGKLVANEFLRHEPPKEQAGEEAAYGQENLTRYEVEDIEKGTSEEGDAINGTERQRTEGSNDAAEHGDDKGCTVALEAELLMEESRRDLVEGDERRQGC